MKSRTSRRIAILVAIAILLSLGPSDAFAKTDLRISGNVIGYSLAARYITLPSYNLLLVNVRNIYRGKEKSRFILVRFFGIDDAYVPTNFGLNKPIEFRLTRTPEYDRSYGQLKIFEFPDENGVFIKVRSIFTLIPGVDENFLLDNTRLPCYSIIS